MGRDRTQDTVPGGLGIVELVYADTVRLLMFSLSKEPQSVANSISVVLQGYYRKGATLVLLEKFAEAKAVFEGLCFYPCIPIPTETVKGKY